MLFDRERVGGAWLPTWVLHEHDARWRFAAKLLAEKVVVDCACGVGQGTVQFAQAGAKHVYAFDLVGEAVEATRRRCSALSTVTVVQASGLALPLPNASVDFYISFETIEHIEDDRAYLAEVARVLRYDGTFICSTPNRSITMPGKTQEAKPWNPFHVREYNQAEFESLLHERFETLRVFGQNPSRRWRVQLLEVLGRHLPGHLGGRINSALKLPRIGYDRLDHHRVGEMQDGFGYEYLVSCCTKRIL